MTVTNLPNFRFIVYTFILCCSRAISSQTHSSFGNPQTLHISCSVHAPPFCFSLIIVRILAMARLSSRILAGLSKDPPAAAVARARASSPLNSLSFSNISSRFIDLNSSALIIAIFCTFLSRFFSRFGWLDFCLRFSRLCFGGLRFGLDFLGLC